MHPVAYTAHWVAAARARESLRPDALFHDPFAAALAGDEGERWIEDADDPLNAYIALRTRFFDDELTWAARDQGVRQVVLLAAGLDARAFRLDWPPGTRLFELDRAEMIAHKQSALDAIGAAPRCARRTLGVDLTTPFAHALRALGFAPAERSAWLVEGLLPYLHAEDVERLFTQVSALAAPGSTLALDVTGVHPFSVPDFAPRAEQMRARGIQMHYACDDPAAMLDGFGWTAQSVRAGELAARAGRAMPKDPTCSRLVSASRRS